MTHLWISIQGFSSLFAKFSQKMKKNLVQKFTDELFISTYGFVSVESEFSLTLDSKTYYLNFIQALKRNCYLHKSAGTISKHLQIDMDCTDAAVPLWLIMAEFGAKNVLSCSSTKYIIPTTASSSPWPSSRLGWDGSTHLYVIADAM